MTVFQAVALRWVTTSLPGQATGGTEFFGGGLALAETTPIASDAGIARRHHCSATGARASTSIDSVRTPGATPTGMASDFSLQAGTTNGPMESLFS
jgi:hypothetical protein